MNDKIARLNKILSVIPFDSTDVLSDVFETSMKEYHDNGFDCIDIGIEYDYSNNTEAIDITISNYYAMNEAFLSRKPFTDENGNFLYKQEVIYRETLPIFTTLNLLIDEVDIFANDVIFNERNCYSDIDGSSFAFMHENIKCVLDDMSQQEELPLEKYLRYTACFPSDVTDFHSFEYLTMNDELERATDIKTVIKETVHEKVISDYFGFRNLLEGIHKTLLVTSLNNKGIRKCSICGKYFVPSNKSNEIYCRIPNDSLNGKTCKEESKKLQQYKREASKGEDFKLHKTIYNRLLRRDKAKENTTGKRGIEAATFSSESIARKKAVSTGTMQLEEYIQWLRKYDAATMKKQGE